MKKFVFFVIVSALFTFAVNAQTNNQSTGDKIKNTTKKVAKTTGKGIEKGYNVGKTTVVKGAKATIGGLKKIFS